MSKLVDRPALLDRYRSGTTDLDDADAGVTDAELDRPQASGGWTARQVVHHLADSESMAYVRLRRLIAGRPRHPGLRRARVDPPAPLRPADRAIASLAVYAVEQRHVAEAANPMSLNERPAWNDAG